MARLLFPVLAKLVAILLLFQIVSSQSAWPTQQTGSDVKIVEATPIVSETGSAATQQDPQSPPTVRCFYNGHWYQAGSLINMGRSDNWCYRTICGPTGEVKYWDNYNCQNTGTQPSYQTPYLQSDYQQSTNQQGTNQQGTNQQSMGQQGTSQQSFYPQGMGQQGTNQQSFYPQGMGQQGTNQQSFYPQDMGQQGTNQQSMNQHNPFSFLDQLFSPQSAQPSQSGSGSILDIFSGMGCWYRGKFYTSGSDIINKRRGRRCFGVYCDWQGRVQRWEDSCAVTVSPPTGAGTASTGFTGR